MSVNIFLNSREIKLKKFRNLLRKKLIRHSGNEVFYFLKSNSFYVPKLLCRLKKHFLLIGIFYSKIDKYLKKDYHFLFVYIFALLCNISVGMLLLYKWFLSVFSFKVIDSWKTQVFLHLNKDANLDIVTETACLCRVRMFFFLDLAALIKILCRLGVILCFFTRKKLLIKFKIFFFLIEYLRYTINQVLIRPKTQLKNAHFKHKIAKRHKSLLVFSRNMVLKRKLFKKIRLNTKKRYPKKKSIPYIFINNTIRNLLVVVMDSSRKVIFSISSGVVGFKGSKRGSTYASQRTIETLLMILRKYSKKKKKK